MPSSFTTVFADDLTGACEIAGCVHRYGFTATVALGPSSTAHQADVLIVDTETRLSSPEKAARSLTDWLQDFRINARPGRVFKKTDSVLRGPIASELVVLAKHTHASRILLVPANPALGRIVRDGRYFIDEIPLEQTAFGQDPHHPARTSATSELVGNVDGFPCVNLAPGEPIPEHGLVIGDASTTDDLARWVAALPANMLPSGSAAFFEALLSTSSEARRHVSNPELTNAPFLLISGTTAPVQRSFLANARSRGVPTIEIPAHVESAPETWTAQVQAAINQHGGACVYPHGVVSSDFADAVAIGNTLAAITRAMVLGRYVTHLIIEGGSTAAAVAASLHWSAFNIIHEWSPGVVTVSPDSHSHLYVTLKPGSYPWPPALLKVILPRQSIEP